MEQLIVAIYTVYLVFVLYTQFCKLSRLLCFARFQSFRFLKLTHILQVLHLRKIFRKSGLVFLSIPEAAFGGVYPHWNLKFHIWYEVETSTKDSPRQKMLIDGVITLVTWPSLFYRRETIFADVMKNWKMTSSINFFR